MMKSTIDPKGMSVVEYLVKRGDTYERIAANFALPDWQAIARFNTLVHPILASPDPRHLPENRRILIPRTVEGYRRWLVTLRVLKAELEGFAMTTDADLDRLDNEQKAFELQLDMVGDVATLLATLGVKAIKGARDAALAVKATEDAAVNHYWFRFAGLEGYADDVSTGLEALHESLEGGFKALRKGTAEKGFDKLTAAFFGRKEFALVRKLGKALASKPRSLQAYAEAAFDSAQAALDYLDYMKPSTISRMWVTGIVFSLPKNLPNETALQKKNLQGAVAAASARMDDKIAAVKEEATMVWGIDLK